jgi:hypothetical protein
MLSQVWLSRRVMLWSLLGLILIGCGGPAEIVAISSEERGLKELGELYRNFADKSKRSPRSFKEFNVKGQQFPMAATMINSGDLVVQWGAPLLPEGATVDAVLAYVKRVPDEGGNVLMQDGRTVKKMTAEEFKATTKAGPR